jgi:hypothetical protein
MTSFLIKSIKKHEGYVENAERGYQHDLANDNSIFSCEKIDNLQPQKVDPHLRFINLGIVSVVEPLKNEVTYSTSDQDRRRSFTRKLKGDTRLNSIKYMIYDNVYQNVLSFDINELYRRYIKFNIDYIDTTYGKYHLSLKTIGQIIDIVKNGYEAF